MDIGHKYSPYEMVVLYNFTNFLQDQGLKIQYQVNASGSAHKNRMNCLCGKKKVRAGCLFQKSEMCNMADPAG